MLARGAEKLAEAAAAMAGEGGRATVLPCDITDQAALEQAVTTALTEFGAIHILDNNAGSSYRRPCRRPPPRGQAGRPRPHGPHARPPPPARPARQNAVPSGHDLPVACAQVPRRTTN